MLRRNLRSFGKDVLRWTRMKLVYQRVTLTKFTTFYFFLALVNCLVLASLQGVAIADNGEAVNIISGLLTQANISSTSTLVVQSGGVLESCKDLPSQPDAKCSVIKGSNSSVNSRRALEFADESNNAGTFFFKRDHPNGMTEFDSDGTITGIQLADGSTLDMNCLKSLLWLQDVLRDALREDAVTLVFHIWLFTLSFVTILNESLPHLCAALAGHLLVTAWGGYRVRDSNHLQGLYEKLVVHGTCNNVDFLGSWWDLRTQHTIPVLALDALAFFAATYLSTKLYKVYARQTLHRVGASPQVHTAYKFVLFLSVSLQLAGFFTIASAAMWIDKASTGTIRSVAKHINLYRAVFIVMGTLELPWVILGWISVRREKRIQWLAFLVISLLLLASSSGIFSSPLYMFILNTWPFFATMTIASFVLIIVTSVLGIICRIHFGRGLPDFLKEKEVLEGADFAPVIFPVARSASTKTVYSLDPEKVRLSSESTTPAPLRPPSAVIKPERAPSRQPKSNSVYSDMNRETVKLSSTPPLYQGQSALSVQPNEMLQVNVRDSVVKPNVVRPKEENVLVRVPSNASTRSAASTLSSSGRKFGLPSNPRQGRNNSPVERSPLNAGSQPSGFF